MSLIILTVQLRVLCIYEIAAPEDNIDKTARSIVKQATEFDLAFAAFEISQESG